MRQRATIILKWFAATVIGTAIIWGGYYVTEHKSDVKQQLTLATTRQAEPLTELFFADPEALPAAIPTTARELPVTFVIHNIESKAMDYTYNVSFIDASGTYSIPNAVVSIPDGQSQSITQVIPVPAGQDRGEVRVQLLNKSQHIHYWLERL